ncbi:Asp23/Gls24 family envelope stress response protein [Candidatus Uhrbacteria bacterium]|nr:Asp23/Gls24 family envelope stress response protein [Candidatus Uhrbacteria bacterium]
MAEKRIEITDESGRVTIADEVIASIARIAAERVTGIARTAGSSGGIKGIFGGDDSSVTVKTELANEQARLELRIAVEYGYAVHSVASGVQESVQKDVEKLAGVTVSSVDVYVKRVVPPQTHEAGRA